MMRTKTGIAVTAAFSLVAAACGGTEAPSGPPFRTETTVRMLMANMLDPAADLIWDSVGTMVDAEGEHHWEPETEEDWLQVKLGAMALAEASNLIIMDQRARDQDQWVRLSEEMYDAAMEVFAAAEAENADLVFELGESIYDSCNSCHSLYWVDDADRGRAIGES